MCHVGAQRLDEQQQDEQIQAELKPSESRHPNHSGFKSAKMR
jgi:hypothetical protein